jgi:acetyl-CoA carboxylase alpha subunit
VETARRVGDTLEDALEELEELTGEELVAQRYRRFRRLGVFEEG